MCLSLPIRGVKEWRTLMGADYLNKCGERLSAIVPQSLFTFNTLSLHFPTNQLLMRLHKQSQLLISCN